MNFIVRGIVVSILSMLLMACEEDMPMNHFKVIAHQGHWRAAEGASNSIRGLEEAVRLELDGVELDVRKSADDSLVLCHDAYHGGYQVATSTFEELRTVRLADGSLIPTLFEYLQAAKLMKHITLFIDVKSENEIKEVCDIANQSGIKERIHLLASWNTG